jgi:hypothetical protein
MRSDAEVLGGELEELHSVHRVGPSFPSRRDLQIRALQVHGFTAAVTAATAATVATVATAAAIAATAATIAATAATIAGVAGVATSTVVARFFQELEEHNHRLLIENTPPTPGE